MVVSSHKYVGLHGMGAIILCSCIGLSHYLLLPWLKPLACAQLLVQQVRGSVCCLQMGCLCSVRLSVWLTTCGESLLDLPCSQRDAYRRCASAIGSVGISWPFFTALFCCASAAARLFVGTRPPCTRFRVCVCV